MNLPAIIRRRRSGVSPLAIYAVLGIRPELVLDFDDEKYFANSLRTTFSDLITHSATTNATMVDSDGLLKWRPHNLALNSATPATQSITVVSGADYTVECTGVSIALSGAGTGTVTEGNPVTITASTTTLTLTVTGSTGTMWAYRSDLGGMVNNPDRGDSYVPTTSSAVYLPRRGHHVYNGTSWVNEGLLHESEQRVNFVSESNNATSWSLISGASVTTNQAASPDGLITAFNVAETAGPPVAHIAADTASFTSGVAYTQSIFLKKGSGVTAPDILQLTFGSAAFGSSQYANYNISTGAVLTSSGGTALIEDFGNGWYRCIFTATATATTPTTSGLIFTNNNDSLGRVPVYSGSLTSDVLVYGFQIEAGSTPSSYIPTSGATVTRAAETLTIPSAKLPWPTPNVIGPELVTNGTFDTDLSSWNNTSSHWQFSSGRAYHPNSSTAFPFTQELTLTAAPYLHIVTFDVEVVSGSLSVLLSPDATGAGSLVVGTVTTSGTYSFVLPNTGNRFIGFWRTFSSSFEGYIDNISVREIDPLAVSIQMQGRATGNTYTTNRWYLDANNYITQEINSSDFTF